MTITSFLLIKLFLMSMHGTDLHFRKSTYFQTSNVKIKIYLKSLI